MIDAQAGDVFNISVRATYHQSNGDSHRFTVTLQNGEKDEFWLPEATLGVKIEPVLPAALDMFVPGSVWTSARLPGMHLMVVGGGSTGHLSMVPSNSSGTMSIATAWQLYGPLRQAFLPASPAPAPSVPDVPDEAEIFPLGSEMPGVRIQAVRRQEHIGTDTDLVFVRTASSQWVAQGRDGNGKYYSWPQLNGNAHGRVLVECEPPIE
jgi:hypothetical protein